MKKSEGITLIALVITIVVLLILAGISIGSITGEKSIIKETYNTGNQAQRESIIQKIEADLYQEKTISGEIPDKAKLKEIIQDKGYNQGELNKNSFITKDGGYEITYDEILGWEDVIEIKFSDLRWENGKAIITVETTAEGYELQYKIENGEWKKIDNNTEIKNIENKQKIYARVIEDGEVLKENSQTIEDNIPPVFANVEASYNGNTGSGILSIEMDIKGNVIDNETGLKGDIQVVIGNEQINLSKEELEVGVSINYEWPIYKEITLIATDNAENVEECVVLVEKNDIF